MINKQVTVSGITSNQWHGGCKTLCCLLPAIELPDYLSIFSAPIELESAFTELTNSTNQKRIESLVEELKGALESNKVLPNIVLTVAAYGKVKFEVNNEQQASLTFKSTNAIAVDGILTLCAILRLLGFELPFSKRKSRKVLALDETHLRQKLSTHMIPIFIMFDDVDGLSQDAVIKLSKDFNQRQDHFHSTQLSRISNDSPLITFVHQLAVQLDLNRLGGMSTSGNRVSKSEGYITTEAAMIQLVLAALGGTTIRVSTTIPTKLPNGTAIDEDLLEQFNPILKVFLESWLIASQEQFNYNRDGFHMSTQLWQALGLVIHELYSRSTFDLNVFEKAGKKLGKLDYARNAKHWSNCKAMTLDASGKKYKNATSGGRTFRELLAEYLVSLILT